MFFKVLFVIHALSKWKEAFTVLNYLKLNVFSIPEYRA